MKPELKEGCLTAKIGSAEQASFDIAFVHDSR